MLNANTPPTAITVEYHESPKEIELKNHFHNSHEIILVVEGTAEFTIHHKTYTVEKNSMIFISNLEYHQVKVKSYPYRRYFLLIEPKYFQTVVSEPVLSSIFKHRPGSFSHVHPLDGPEDSRVLNIFQEMYLETASGKPFSPEYLGALALQLLIAIYRNHPEAFPYEKSNHGAKTVLEVQKYIDRNYREQISLEDVSRQFYIDMYYLSHLFRKVTGFSFRQYLLLQRIAEAKNRLFYTDETITEVASNSGFNNVNHFIRAFKKLEGIPPYQYRKLHHKN